MHIDPSGSGAKVALTEVARNHGGVRSPQAAVGVDEPDVDVDLVDAVVLVKGAPQDADRTGEMDAVGLGVQSFFGIPSSIKAIAPLSDSLRIRHSETASFCRWVRRRRAAPKRGSRLPDHDEHHLHRAID